MPCSFRCAVSRSKCKITFKAVQGHLHPQKNQGYVHPQKKQGHLHPSNMVSFKTVADVTKDVSLVDSLDMDDMELESIDTTIASVAASALMKETPTHFSTPMCPRPPASEPQPSTSMGTGSQPPPKKLKLGLSRPCSKDI